MTQDAGKAIARKVGENVRAARTKLGLTQAQLAGPDYSISYISAIERGKIRPSLKAIGILAKRLDLPVSWLLEGTSSSYIEAKAVGYTPPTDSRDVEVDLNLNYVAVLIRQSNLELAEELLVMNESNLTTDQVLQFRMLHGQLYLARKDYERAVTAFMLAEEQASAMGDADSLLRARSMLGLCNIRIGDFASAKVIFNKCVAMMEELEHDDVFLMAEIYHNIGEMQMAMGNTTAAMEHFQRALAVREELKHEPRLYAERLTQLSAWYKGKGWVSQALYFAEQAGAVHSMLGHQYQLEEASLNLAISLYAMGNYQEAEAKLKSIIESGFYDVVLKAWVYLSRVLIKRASTLGKKDAATDLRTRALEAAQMAAQMPGDDQELVGFAQVQVAEVLLARKAKFDLVRAEFEAAIELLEANQSEHLAEALSRWATVLEEKNLHTEALNVMKRALELERKQQGQGGDFFLE